MKNFKANFGGTVDLVNTSSTSTAGTVCSGQTSSGLPPLLLFSQDEMLWFLSSCLSPNARPNSSVQQGHKYQNEQDCVDGFETDVGVKAFYK